MSASQHAALQAALSISALQLASFLFADCCGLFDRQLYAHETRHGAGFWRTPAPVPDSFMADHTPHEGPILARQGAWAAPLSGPPVAGKHQKPDRDLGKAEQGLKQHVPCRSGRREHPGKFQDRRRYAQNAEQEGDQDQPERPAPAPQNPDNEECDESRDRTQKRQVSENVPARGKLHGAVVDPRLNHEDGHEADPGHQEEPEYERLHTVDHCDPPPTCFRKDTPKRFGSSAGSLRLHPALTQLPVEQEERLALVSHHLQGLDDVPGVLLFFDLLRNEPLEKGLAGVVVLAYRKPVEVMDHRRDLPLVLEGLLEDLKR